VNRQDALVEVDALPLRPGQLAARTPAMMASTQAARSR
jgi:hypothetical protein